MYRMTFYCIKEKDGTIHVQNVVRGMLGQHHVHTVEDFEKWRNGEPPISDDSIEWLEGTTPCDCGLKAGEVRQGALAVLKLTGVSSGS